MCFATGASAPVCIAAFHHLEVMPDLGHLAEMEGHAEFRAAFAPPRCERWLLWPLDVSGARAYSLANFLAKMAP